MSRVLKDGGLLWLSVPFIWGEHEVPFDFRRYSSFGLKKLVQENGGLDVVYFEKMYPGPDALSRLMRSEINVEGREAANCGQKIKLGHRKYFKKLNLLLIKIFFFYMSSFYSFGRVYQNNLLVARKQDI